MDEDKSREFSINDPILLENMTLSKSVYHPVTGVALLTRGRLLTRRTVSQLKNLGIETLFATPRAAEQMVQAVKHIRSFFNSIELIVVVKGQSINNAIAAIQEMQSIQSLQDMVHNHLQDTSRHFNQHAADSLIKLNNHHPDSAHHSVITGFNVMAIAKELRWSEEKTLEASMAATVHDIGKVSVPLKTLDWPGRLNTKQWEEIQIHTLFGGRLLYKDRVNSSVLVAMTHHEWYAKIKNKGYGGLTLFRDVISEEIGIDIDGYLQKATLDQLDILQICVIADMVSALEEIRSYKGALPPFKVMIIMNSDAQAGHFNPEHYKAWHRFYQRKHRQLLPKGLRVALPREKERPMERSGKSFIGLDATIHRLSFHELKQLGLLPKLRANFFDLDLIKKEDGITLDRIQNRDIEINEKKLKKYNIHPKKKILVLLPATEKRLNQEDLIRYKVSEELLIQKEIVKLLAIHKNGISLFNLNKLGIHIPAIEQGIHDENLNKKIFYDLLVVEEIDSAHALFSIVREGDTLEQLEQANADGRLDPLQHYLFNKIGKVEIDFSDLTTTLPDLSHIHMGSHWQPTKKER